MSGVSDQNSESTNDTASARKTSEATAAKEKKLEELKRLHSRVNIKKWTEADTVRMVSGQLTFGKTNWERVAGNVGNGTTKK